MEGYSFCTSLIVYMYYQYHRKKCYRFLTFVEFAGSRPSICLFNPIYVLCLVMVICIFFTTTNVVIHGYKPLRGMSDITCFLRYFLVKTYQDKYTVRVSVYRYLFFRTNGLRTLLWRTFPCILLQNSTTFTRFTTNTTTKIIRT